MVRAEVYTQATISAGFTYGYTVFAQRVAETAWCHFNFRKFKFLYIICHLLTLFYPWWQKSLFQDPQKTLLAPFLLEDVGLHEYPWLQVFQGAGYAILP